MQKPELRAYGEMQSLPNCLRKDDLKFGRKSDGIHIWLRIHGWELTEMRTRLDGLRMKKAQSPTHSPSARNLLSRPPHRERSDRGGASGRAGVWALNKLTHQHELALVVPLEQIYRAYTIKAGLP